MSVIYAVLAILWYKIARVPSVYLRKGKKLLHHNLFLNIYKRNINKTMLSDRGRSRKIGGKISI